MCGIVFAIASSPVDGFVRKANARQRHRGPDGEGLFFEKVGDSYLGFAHQRLAILDLSINGAQPMVSASGRTRMIFNGEIYNYRELAAQYGLNSLKTGTDTEVVLELIEKLGIEAASKVFNGMWTIVAHDRQKDKVFISRDRFGKKPLYFFQTNDGIIFASEMRTLLENPKISRKPNSLVAARYLAQAIMNLDNQSWIEGVEAFPPATTAAIDVRKPAEGLKSIQPFWTPELVDLSGDHRSEADILAELEYLVGDAVKLRLHADVPVGIALSGGLDSSIISALALRGHSHTGNAIKLFSATNPGSRDDESKFVLEMSRHLSLDVTQFTLSPGSGSAIEDLVRTCIGHNDGPIMSFSNVLFFKLMEAAKEAGITVILTGQGADEVFCGYRKYPMLELKRKLKQREFLNAARFGINIFRRGTVFNEFKFSEAKRYLGGDNFNMLGPVARSAYIQTRLSTIDTLAARQWQDIAHLSVPYLCHYEDRMSMAWAREVRTPFLDFRLVELGLKMPTALKMANGWTKYPLRRAFSNSLPHSIAWRKDKKGFVNPQDEWMRGALRNRVLEIMSDPSAEVYKTGLVDKKTYLSVFDAYCKGDKKIWFRDVFSPFSLNLWLQTLSEGIEA
jgi:asparagine synthase (glutamine-hydrolysing)